MRQIMHRLGITFRSLRQTLTRGVFTEFTEDRMKMAGDIGDGTRIVLIDFCIAVDFVDGRLYACCASSHKTTVVR